MMYVYMNVVYVSFRGYSSGGGRDVLGVFSARDRAITRCLGERSLTRSDWWPTKDRIDHWGNGAGMYVCVVEYSVE